MVLHDITTLVLSFSTPILPYPFLPYSVLPFSILSCLAFLFLVFLCPAMPFPSYPFPSLPSLSLSFASLSHTLLFSTMFFVTTCLPCPSRPSLVVEPACFQCLTPSYLAHCHPCSIILLYLILSRHALHIHSYPAIPYLTQPKPKQPKAIQTFP